MAFGSVICQPSNSPFGASGSPTFKMLGSKEWDSTVRLGKSNEEELCTEATYYQNCVLDYSSYNED